MSELCITVVGESVEAIQRARDAAARDADIVELRLDSMRHPDVAGAMAGRTAPVIVTCRPRREGGMYDGPEHERLALLREALTRGADFVDVEWDADFAPEIAARGGRGVIVSRHDFSGVPPDPAGRLRQMRATGAEIVKLAATTGGI